MDTETLYPYEELELSLLAEEGSEYFVIQSGNLVAIYDDDIERATMRRDSVKSSWMFHSFNDEPAILLQDGTALWYTDGLLDREKYPAESLPSGKYGFWLQGKRHRLISFAVCNEYHMDDITKYNGGDERYNTVNKRRNLEDAITADREKSTQIGKRNHIIMESLNNQEIPHTRREELLTEVQDNQEKLELLENYITTAIDNLNELSSSSSGQQSSTRDIQLEMFLDKVEVWIDGVQYSPDDREAIQNASMAYRDAYPDRYYKELRW